MGNRTRLLGTPRANLRELLDLALIENGAAIDELRATTQELRAISEGLLNVNGHHEKVLVDQSIPPILNSNQHGGLQNPDLAHLKRNVDVIFRKGHAAMQESRLLRMRLKDVRASWVQSGDRNPNSPHADYDSLSKRERQILTLIVAGETTKQIAAKLGMAFKTVTTHRASIMTKLKVHELASVVREALLHGLA